MTPVDIDKLKEQIARVIDPRRWEVLDGYLADMLRKYAGQQIGYDPEAFKDKASLAKAEAILALVSPALIAKAERVDALMEALKPFAALRLSTEVEVSDLLHRTPAAEARRHADAIERRDAEILAARNALSPKESE